ncbi:MAG: hypothetical protein LBC99_01260 [Spirochaetota bacterium]|jgi:hypothetical protein|nr:hypothetical protein [Spirochaetota bacterium]
MQPISLAIPERLLDARGLPAEGFVRGRVLEDKGGQKYLEYAGGRITLPNAGTIPSGWHTFRVAREGSTVHLILQREAAKDTGTGIRQNMPLLSHANATNQVNAVLLARLFTFLYPDRKFVPKIKAEAAEKVSLAESFLQTFFPLKKDALEALQTFLRGTEKLLPPDDVFDGESHNGEPTPCLFRFEIPFLTEDSIPVFVVPQDQDSRRVFWLFSEIDLEGLGHTACTLRLDGSQIDGDIYCRKGCSALIAENLPASLASLRLHEQEIKEPLCDWALLRILETHPGRCDAYA